MPVDFTEAYFKNKYGEDEEVISTMKFVELPGSELKGGLNGANTDRLRSLCKINSDRSAFTNVVSVLADNATKYTHKPRVVPYKRSPLTLFLKDSLGGNAKTLVMCMISPSDTDFDDSMSTLSFVQKTIKFIRNRAVITKNVRQGMIKSLKSELDFLADETISIDKDIESARNVSSLDNSVDEREGDRDYAYMDTISPTERKVIAAERREILKNLKLSAPC